MAKKEGGGGGDELDILKSTILAKDFEVITIMDKMRRLEERSQLIQGSMEKLSIGAREKIFTLTEIIEFLTSEGNTKDAKIKELESALEIAEQDRKDTIIHMNKEMTDLTSAHEFQFSSMKLKLEAAQVRIREMQDFSLKKKAIEDENAALKEQLLKEQRDHAEAISDVERVSIQEKERLKKEIQTRVQETKKEMSATLKDQLHLKTKRTIVENEQLRKEVGYHSHQTEILLQKNKKLLEEVSEATRSLQLAKELEEDLARRNHMYQQTTRILVYKLREKQTIVGSFKKGIMQEENDNGVSKETVQNLLNQTRTTTQNEAIKFLYTCLEDIELERIAKLPVENVTMSAKPTPRKAIESNISNFSLTQRRALLTALLQQASSLHSMTNNMTKEFHAHPSIVQNPQRSQGLLKSKVQVDDILAMPVEKILEENRSKFIATKPRDEM